MKAIIRFLCIALSATTFACIGNQPKNTADASLSELSSKERKLSSKESSLSKYTEPGKMDPYQIIDSVFEGYPGKSQVQPMLEAVMKRYNFPVTNDNILKAGNLLCDLKRASKVGVTEMEIVKHMYQQGSAEGYMFEQAGISAATLETTR
jgi:hypothetical protein